MTNTHIRIYFGKDDEEGKIVPECICPRIGEHFINKDGYWTVRDVVWRRMEAGNGRAWLHAEVLLDKMST